MAKKNTTIIVLIIIGFYIFSQGEGFLGATVAPVGPVNGPADCSFSTNINPWAIADFNSWKSPDAWIAYDKDGDGAVESYWYESFTNIMPQFSTVIHTASGSSFLDTIEIGSSTIYVINTDRTFAAKYGRNSGKEGIATSHCAPAPCVDSSWSPSVSTECEGVSFTQTSNCGTTRTATGQKDCTVPPECTIDSDCPTGEECVANVCNVITSTTCSDLRNSLGNDIFSWLSGTITRPVLGTSIASWVSC